MKEIGSGAESDREEEEQKEGALHRGRHRDADLADEQSGDQRTEYRSELKAAYPQAAEGVPERDRQKQRDLDVLPQ